jgi:hypothetical protein
MYRQPSDREKTLMIELSFDNLQEMEEWLSQPLDPLASQRMASAPLQDEVDEEDLLPDDDSDASPER